MGTGIRIVTMATPTITMTTPMDNMARVTITSIIMGVVDD
jgi:hypothetical protein